MRAAVDRIDVVRIGINNFIITLVVLQGDFADRRSFVFFKVERLCKQGFVALVDLLYQFADTAFVAESIRALLALALVGQGDAKPLVEECKFL